MSEPNRYERPTTQLMSICQDCGSAVFSRAKHNRWHGQVQGMCGVEGPGGYGYCEESPGHSGMHRVRTSLWPQD